VNKYLLARRHIKFRRSGIFDFGSNVRYHP
jgi:hypothetical protein